MVPVLLLKHEMQMRGSPGMSTQPLQQLSDWPVVGNGIAHGLDAREPEAPFAVAHHNAPLARLFAVRVLYVVVPAAVRLPDINLHACYWPARSILNGADAEEGLSLWIRRHF